VETPVEGVGARTDRVAQSAVGIALLAAFVFRVPLVVPVVALLLAAGALVGARRSPLIYAFDRWIGPHLPARGEGTEEPIPASTVRMQDAFGAGVLAIASVAFVFGIGIAGWALAIAEAVVAIVAATTRIHVGERLRRGL
jgi:hypothetical protein